MASGWARRMSGAGVLGLACHALLVNAALLACLRAGWRAWTADPAAAAPRTKHSVESDPARGQRLLQWEDSEESLDKYDNSWDEDNEDFWDHHDTNQDDYDFLGTEAQDLQSLRWLNHISPLMVLASCCLEFGTVFVYWALFVRPTAEKILPPHVVVPEDLRGRWAHSPWECCSAPGTCLCFAFCSPCAVSELWYRAGWIHVMFGQNAAGSAQGCCPGWQWFAGIVAWCIAADVAACCLPFGHATGRGGLRWIDGSNGGLGELEDHRKRFGLPHEGFSTFCEDCCLWCWCVPCVGTQEYRQVMALLNRGELQVAPPVTVGVPVQVVGQPVVASNVVVVQGNSK